MISHEQDVVINRPVEAVFGFLTDLSAYPSWQKDIVEYRQTSPGPLTAGSTGVVVRNVMGFHDESTWRIAELVPNSLYVIKSTSGSLAYEITNSLHAEGAATHIHVRFQAEPTGLLKVAEPVMAGAIKQGFSEGYQNMKRILESA